MIRAAWSTITVAVLMVVTGCVQESQQQKPVLTADAAKQALLGIDSRQIPPGVLVPPPEDKPIEFVSPDEISIGIYHCNLAAKTFHASANYPNADRHKFNNVSGVFEQNADGTWVARVTESSSGG